MNLKPTIILLIVFMTYGCALSPTKDKREVNKNTTQDSEIKIGVLIENGPNQGITHTDTLGMEYNYRYNTTIITNDTTIPINLELGLANEFNYQAPCSGSKYKIFLLPEVLTPNTVTLYNNIYDGLPDFLNRCIDKQFNLKKTLYPGGTQIITVGRLNAKTSPCSINLNKLSLKGDSLYYTSSDDAIVILCGKISYAES